MILSMVLLVYIMHIPIDIAIIVKETPPNIGTPPTPKYSEILQAEVPSN